MHPHHTRRKREQKRRNTYSYMNGNTRMGPNYMGGVNMYKRRKTRRRRARYY